MRGETKVFLERVSPEEKSTAVFKLHFATYKFAEKFVADKKVLDIGCGTGYGSNHLAQWALEVVGGDISFEAIEYAKKHYEKENLKFQIMDCTASKLPNNSFDVVCALELLEHVRDYERFLKEVHRILKPDGLAIISTPNKKIFSSSEIPLNPHHFKEFYLEELESLLVSFFSDVEIHGQKGNIKVREVFQGNRLKCFLARLDFLKIRQLLPYQLYKILSKLFNFSIQEELRVDDFPVLNYDVEKAEVFVAICRKD